MGTRAHARTGTGSTAALAKTQIGADIVMPAGGPWIIHNLWAQVAKVTTIPDQGTGGDLIIETLAGDFDPNPTPGVFPLIGSPANPSANDGIAPVPLNLWDVGWTAQGKASFKLSYRQELAITTASVVACGVIFGENRPERVPIKFCQVKRASFASATEQDLGEIQLSEGATRITGFLFSCQKGDAVTIAEPMVVTIRLASDDIEFPPSRYPCNVAFNAADGTPVGAQTMPMSQFIPVDIPVIGGARVNIFATSTQSVTGNIDISAYVAYE